LYLVLFATIASAPIGFLTALYIVEVKAGLPALFASLCKR